MYKLFLFDIDDTICNASEAYEIAKVECFKYLKKMYPLIDKEMFDSAYAEARNQIHRELKGMAASHERFLYFQRMFELLGLPLQPRVIYQVSKLYWKTTIQNLRLFNGVKETLEIIKENNIRIGVVSDLVANVQLSKLVKLGIDKNVDFIVTSEEAKREKPHPASFLLAMKKGKARPEETIMVGGSLERDVQGAKNLGITAVWMTERRSENRKAEIEKADIKRADYIIQKFDQLLPIMGIKKQKFSEGKILAFDLSGTILKEPHMIRNILHPLVRDSGLRLSYKRVKELYNLYSEGLINRETFRKFIPKEIEERYLEMIDIDPTAPKTFDYLKRKGYKLGILSNQPVEWGEYFVSKFKLKKWFSTIVFSGEYKTKKPSEKLYIIFAQKAKVKPINCYFIDDKLENLKEARFLLMKTIHIEREKPNTMFLPDFRIHKISDLMKIM